MRVEVYYRDAEENTPNVFDAKDIRLAQLYGQRYLIIIEENTTVLISYEAIACVRIHGIVQGIEGIKS